MKKLLYITDQNEYIDHSFIAPLFDIYLKKYFKIDILYFTEFKSDFECKEKHYFTMPCSDKKNLIKTLEYNKIDISLYDYVMVRNDIEVMQEVLKYKEVYDYKALYRFSYPKSNLKLHSDQVKKKNTFFAPLRHYFQIQKETAIINLCDAFLPTSLRMKKTFRPDVTVPTILCPPAINPLMLRENEQHDSDEKRFFYAGTVDKTREFKVILNAFKEVKSKRWQLNISSIDREYIAKILEKYPSIKGQITVHTAKTKQELLGLISKSDIGIALLPNIPIYNSSLPVKIFDYYASALPCLMTHSPHTDSIFRDKDTAWFCDFSVHKISKKLAYLIKQSKEDIKKVGLHGQAHLLEERNYENIAQTIATQLGEI